MTEVTYTSTDTPVRTELTGRPGAEAPETSQEYEKFRDLAGKLLQVPKDEIRTDEN